MSNIALHPPKKRGVFSPILLELTIVILFFALSTSVIVRLIAAASETARESEYHARAILAMETVAEQVKADPAGFGEADECGVWAFSREISADLSVGCVVTADPSPAAGTLYDIELSVVSPGGEVYALTAARYVPKAEVAP